MAPPLLSWEVYQQIGPNLEEQEVVELSLAWMEEAGVEVEVVQGRLMAACGFGEQTDMVVVAEEEEVEVDWLFWLGTLSEVEWVVVLMEVAWPQMEEEGHLTRMKTKHHLSDQRG